MDQRMTHVGTDVLAKAIERILHNAEANLDALPRNGFQQRMRFAGLVEAGRDVSALAQAAVVLLRRSRSDEERA